MSNIELSIVSSNLNRLNPNSDISKLFLRSILWQKNRNIELIITDGGSSNIDEVEAWFKDQQKDFELKIIKTKLPQGLFSRGYLNNVGVKRANGKYIMTTDVDIMFSPLMSEKVLSSCRTDLLIEARTLYWRRNFAQQVYAGKVDPEKDILKCSTGHGRVKYRTTAGGCQCMHRDNWFKLRGYDERYKVWGSEDASLILRANLMGLRERWICEERPEIILFHQPHAKTNPKVDLEWQDKNKQFLNNTKTYEANPLGWGEINE